MGRVAEKLGFTAALTAGMACVADDGGTPLFTATISTTTPAGTTSGASSSAPDDDDTPTSGDDDDQGPTTADPSESTTGPSTTTGGLRPCVDLDLGSAQGVDVATGTSVDAGDDFELGECGSAGTAGSMSTTGGTSFTTGGGFVTGDTTGGEGPGDDYVIRWTAPRAGTWAFSLRGSQFDTLVGIFAPMCGGAPQVCNDDCGSLQSGIDVELVAGETVFIVVDGFRGRTGPFTLSIEPGAVDCGTTTASG